MPKKITSESFKEKANEVHNNLYDYSLVDYKGCYEKVKIICSKHGIFEQTPNNHLNGQTCPICANLKRNNWHKLSKEEFVKKANKIHNNFYNYDKTIITNNLKNKSIITCPVHGDFEQSLNNHLNNHGCPKCKGKKLTALNSKTTEQFIKEAKEIHDYDYSLTKYVNNKTKVKIICNKHGIFEQTPFNHLQLKQGCPSCSSSHGEKEIEKYLTKNNFSYIKEKTFEDLLSDKGNFLRYDFYLQKENLLIEYNGVQHYKPVNHFGGRKKFLLQKHHDWLKRKYAKEKNIQLLTIMFTEDIVETLDNFLKGR